VKIRALISGVLIALAAGVAGFLIQQQFARTSEQPVTHVESPENSLIGELRPDFSLPDKDGNMRFVQEWDGQVLVINFWATWCSPCREEIPEFIKLQNKYAKQGLQFIGIALNKPEEVHDFAAELGMNYPILAGEMEVIKVAEEYGNRFGILPYTVVIDRSRHIVFIKKGTLHSTEADAIIAALL